MARKSHFSSAPVDDTSQARLTPMALTKQEFGRRLQKLLAERGWNQSELARRAVLGDGKNLGRDAISTYVNGRSFPTPLSLDALAKAFGVSHEDLLPNAAMNALDDEIPAFEMKAAAGHPGKAWVRINRAMSFGTAAEIARLLNEEDMREQ